MSNLGDAKASLQAELSQAKAVLAHYQGVVTSLEYTIATITSMGAPAPATKSSTKAKSMQHPSPVAKKGRGRPKNEAAVVAAGPKKSRSTVKALPKTDRPFVLGLLSQEPKTMEEVVAAAVAQIDGKLSDDLLGKLKMRLTTNLSGLVKSAAIKDSGKGRTRQFFLP